MNTFKIILVASVALALVACDKKKDGPQPDRSSDRPSVPATPIKDAASDAPRLEQGAVEEFLLSWRESVGESDLDSYMSHYADNMIGIVFDGEGVSEFDRSGWKKRRADLLDVQMSVDISQPDVRVGQHVAVVDFKQMTRIDGNEASHQKLVVIESTDSGPRIIREEERLSSTVEKESQELATDLPGQVLADRYVVVETEVDESWAKGLARPAKGILAYKSVDTTRLPKRFSKYNGLNFEVQTPQGTACSRKSNQLRLVARATLPRGEAEVILQERPKKGAEELYEMAGKGGLVLAVELDEPCIGGVFASSISGAVDRVETFEALEEIPESALLNFRRDARWQKIQKEYVAKTGQTDFWDGGPEAWVARHGEDGFVAIQAEAGEGCGGFRGELFALYKMRGDDAEPLTVGDQAQGIFRPVVVAQFSRSQDPVFYSREKIVAETDGKWSVIQDLTPPSYICPC